MASLGGKVRRLTESDEVDLAGYDQERCNEFVKAAFSEPFVLTSMIRLSCVVGGGKLVRQKYSDDLPQKLMIALDGIGFDQDNAADLSLSSAGKYKFHHDTNKNLKFVHVYPRAVAPTVENATEEGGEEEGEEEGERDPADVLAECEVEDFRRVIASHVASYVGKKRLLDALKVRIAKMEEAERKLIEREVLDDALQKLYDTLSVDGLKEKVQVLAGELQSMIDAGQLTADEKAMVQDQLDGKLTALQAELDKAEADGKTKLKCKLEEAQEKLKATKAAVSGAAPAPKPPLKYAKEIQKLHVRLAGLSKMEKENAGKYTIDQLKVLGERPEMEEALSVYKARSRVWFETDEEFDGRLKLCLSQAPKPKAQSNATAGYSSGGGSGWSTVSSSKRR
jgi:hypothetical protein